MLSCTWELDDICEMHLGCIWSFAYRTETSVNWRSYPKGNSVVKTISFVGQAPGGLRLRPTISCLRLKSVRWKFPKLWFGLSFCKPPNFN